VSNVGKVYKGGGAGVRFPVAARILLFITSRPALVPTRSPTKRILAAVSLGVKGQGREADHSLPSSAEVKNGGAIPPLPSTSSWRGA
jgi:hypothetical protein